MTIDPMPRTNAELPPRYPEAAEITRLRAALDAAEKRAQEAILDAIVAQGQAEEAHEARLKAEAERDAARAKALEDAAKVADKRRDAMKGCTVEAALALLDALPDAIRAMIEQEDKG